MSEEQSHIISYRTFTVLWVALLVLTLVTIAVAQVDLGAWNIWVAIGIATFKSSLVVAIFMHMKYEHWFFKVSLLITFVILAIFIGLNFFDVLYRH